MLLPMVVSTIVAFLIKSMYPVNSLFPFIIKVGCWALIHLPIMWFLMMNKYEKGLVKEMIEKITKKYSKKENNKNT